MSNNGAIGRLEVVSGSMFAGKTEHVIHRLHELEQQGKNVKAFKHAIDDRYAPDHLVTHRGERFPATRVRNAALILEQIEGAEVVAIDEGHFFKIELLPVVQTLINSGVTVFVAGIAHDIWGRPFDPMPQLSEIADEVVIRYAPCRVCGEPAPFNQRLTPVSSLLMVGGLSDYEPRCAAHFTPSSAPREPK